LTEHGLTRKSMNLEHRLETLKHRSSQERNLRTAPDSVRDITERGLAEARSDLHLKELRAQQLRQDLQSKQVVMTKLNEIERKNQDIETLERERERITRLLDHARADVQRLNQEYLALTQPGTSTAPVLVLDAGSQIELRQDAGELLVGCADSGTFPDIDLTPVGGTANGVSRRHAVLRHTNGTWTITDLNSTNGTFVNGARISANVPTPVQNQSKLRFGRVEATFVERATTPQKTVRFT
jgi:glucose-6-phosphate-specific signal transduction histidine kinase